MVVTNHHDDCCGVFLGQFSHYLYKLLYLMLPEVIGLIGQTYMVVFSGEQILL